MSIFSFASFLFSLSVRAVKNASLLKTRQVQFQKATTKLKEVVGKYKDLQAKFHHFEVAEYKQYLEVWQMNQTSVVDFARKVREPQSLSV